MKKPKLADCPFCGKTPSGKIFCSTMQGPALTCDHCQADGPPALDREFVGVNEDKHRPLAIEKWNKRARDLESYQHGIAVAAAFVEQFEKVAIKYFQSRFVNDESSFGRNWLKVKREFDRAMKEFFSHVDRRIPARRKTERRIPGGPEFILGSLLSKERRQRNRREGAVRRRP